MGLAVSNIRLLTLTSRKADCEYNISIDSMEKMALTRQQSQLTQEYYAKLKAKTISYYSNGQYNMMDYSYLMGDAFTASQIIYPSADLTQLKKDSSMVLTDNNGYVVMSDTYAQAIQDVLGTSCMDVNGRGTTFSIDQIPEMISNVVGGYCSTDDIKQVINDGKIESNYDVNVFASKSKALKSSGSHDNSDSVTSTIEAIVNYYYPIFQAAAANGWTTEYNKDMSHNKNYVSDALVTGTFQLEQVDAAGAYKPDASLTYFVTSGLVLERTDSNVREEVTAWYNAEKEAISEKEGWIDLELSDLSTELEAINTEIEAVKSLIQDNMNVFDWCNG